MTFDKKMYDFRKKRYRERIKKTIAYAENQFCRSKSLLEYFDEKDAKECGICDVCLERAKTKPDADEYERYKFKIQNLLKRDTLTIEEVLDSFSPKHQNRVLNVIEYLLDEKILKKDDEKLMLN